MPDVVTDPASLGFDPSRLARIDRHFARYVDDGLLAGWQILVTRGGQVAHSSCTGNVTSRPACPSNRTRCFASTR